MEVVYIQHRGSVWAVDSIDSFEGSEVPGPCVQAWSSKDGVS